MRAFKLRLDIFFTTKSVTHICNDENVYSFKLMAYYFG